MPTQQQGFSIIETVVAIFVLALLAVAVTGVASLGTRTAVQSEQRVVAQGIATAAMEHIKGIILYDDIGYVDSDREGTEPDGALVKEREEVINGITYTVQTTVQLVDDPANGAQGGALVEGEEDYRTVDIVVEWQAAPGFGQRQEGERRRNRIEETRVFRRSAEVGQECVVDSDCSGCSICQAGACVAGCGANSFSQDSGNVCVDDEGYPVQGSEAGFCAIKCAADGQNESEDRLCPRGWVCEEPHDLGSGVPWDPRLPPLLCIPDPENQDVPVPITEKPLAQERGELVVRKGEPVFPVFRFNARELAGALVNWPYVAHFAPYEAECADDPANDNRSCAQCMWGDGSFTIDTLHATEEAEEETNYRELNYPLHPRYGGVLPQNLADAWYIWNVRNTVWFQLASRGNWKITVESDDFDPVVMGQLGDLPGGYVSQRKFVSGGGVWGWRATASGFPHFDPSRDESNMLSISNSGWDLCYIFYDGTHPAAPGFAAAFTCPWFFLPTQTYIQVGGKVQGAEDPTAGIVDVSIERESFTSCFMEPEQHDSPFEAGATYCGDDAGGLGHNPEQDCGCSLTDAVYREQCDDYWLVCPGRQSVSGAVSPDKVPDLCAAWNGFSEHYDVGTAELPYTQQCAVPCGGPEDLACPQYTFCHEAGGQSLCRLPCIIDQQCPQDMACTGVTDNPDAPFYCEPGTKTEQCTRYYECEYTVDGPECTFLPLSAGS